MLRRTAAITLALLIANAAGVSAADKNGATDATAPIGAAVTRAVKTVDPSKNLWAAPQIPRRPALLPILYGTYATFQAMDVMSTKKALAAGAHETNPSMTSGSLGAMLAVKAAGGAATIYFAEKAWRKNRVGAVVLMAALNGATAAIAARNVRNARR